MCYDRHPSNEFSYGNTSVTVKMMNQDGTFLPGEMTQDLGYVSDSDIELVYLIIIFCVNMTPVFLVFETVIL